MGDPASGSVTSFNSDYTAATPTSLRIWQEARAIFPGGVSGQAKVVAPYPVFVASASGATLTDVDGRTYVDLLMGAGPLLIGHSHPAVVSAVQQQVGVMANPMMPVRESLEYARRLREHMPYLEKLRFTNTGSEATRSAIRVARAVTGRHKIAKFEGNYHGSDDWALVSAHTPTPKGPPLRPDPVADYAGMSPAVLDEVVVLPYNAPEAAAAIIDEVGHELAAVIMEPVAFSSGGSVPATPAFARTVRDAVHRNGALLIFDEVLCALRLGLAGAPGYLGVVPDLATAGKAIGGGLPLALFGGRAELMEATLGADAGDRRVFQSGTFTENPLSIAAGAATLTVLETTDALERADSSGEMLRSGLRAIVADRGIESTVTGVGSIAQIHFGVTAVSNRRDVLAGEPEMTRSVLLGMMAGGVLWPPFHPAITSSAHEESHIDRVLSTMDDVLRTLA
ncbi:MAG: aspartate aminotransferase family protein [Acidimicrobiales bacterium]